MLPRSKIIVIGSLLLLHLGIVFSGTIIHRYPHLPYRINALLSNYYYYTGCNAYRFFAPDVARQTIAKCTMIDKAGVVSTEVVGYGYTGTQLRISNLLQYLNVAAGADATAKIAADYCYRTHQGIKDIVVTVGRIKYRKPEQYQSSDTLQITELYQATYTYE